MKLEDYIKPDGSGWTPLHDALRHGHLDEVVSDLALSGEKISLKELLLKDDRGWTPLHEAALTGHINQVFAALEFSGEKLLLKHLFTRDNIGRTPFHYAASGGYLDQVVAGLKISGEKLSLQDFLFAGHHEKETPLHWAAQKGRLDQVLAALEPSGERFSYQDLLIKDANGRTPLDKASRPEHGPNDPIHLVELFAPAIWKGHLGEMMKLWEHLPEERQRAAGFDFNKVVEETIWLSAHHTHTLDPGAFQEATRTTGSLPNPEEPSKESVLAR